MTYQQSQGDTLSSVETLMESILRGAAKILGCISANLVVFEGKSRRARVRIGTTAAKQQEIDEIEDVFGKALRSASFDFTDIEEGLVYAAWRERTVFDTASLRELVGKAFAPEIIEEVSGMIGRQRFICVPVAWGRNSFGVIIFTKEDPSPFGLQQREILLRYAQRIGEIIENEMHGRTTFDSTPSGATPPPVARTYLVFNQAGERCGFSCPPEEPGQTSNQLDTVDELSGVLADHIRAFLRDGRPTSIRLAGTKCMSPFGSETAPQPRRWAEISKLLINGEPHALCTLSTSDRTMHKPSGDNQLLCFALGETAPCFLVDPELDITSCNEASERVFGYAPGELIGSSIGRIFRDPQDIFSILDHQFLFLSDGYFEDVASVRLKDGRIVPGKIEAVLLADEENRVVGFLVLIRDQSRLTSDSADENVSNQLMRRERLATMGEIAAQLAHEIRNPLVSIGASLETLAAREGGKGTTARMLSAVAREVTRVDTILRDYLSLAVRRNATVKRVDLAGSVAGVISLLDKAHVAEGKRLVADADGSITVIGDPDGLRHVFHNLLQNSLEATPPGGTIRCSVTRQNGDAVVCIEDDGSGLACEASECFRPFFTTKQHGTGLGLTVCKKIIEAHGGNLLLKNRPGGGCRAMLILPTGVE